MKKIDNILAYLHPEQYCCCIYKNSKVSIGKSIKQIPKYAFYGAEIKEVHLHPDIKLIDESAHFIESIIKINMQEHTNIKTMGNDTFYSSRKVTFYLPQTLETIGSYAFANMYSVVKLIEISNSVASIGKSCFKDCFSIASIYIPNSVTSICKNCFKDCFSLKSISIPNSVTSICKNCRSLTSKIIEKEVEFIWKKVPRFLLDVAE